MLFWYCISSLLPCLALVGALVVALYATAATLEDISRCTRHLIRICACSMNTADVVLGDTANISPAVFSAVALAVEIIFLLVITLLCSRTHLPLGIAIALEYPVWMWMCVYIYIPPPFR